MQLRLIHESIGKNRGLKLHMWNYEDPKNPGEKIAYGYILGYRRNGIVMVELEGIGIRNIPLSSIIDKTQDQ